MAPDLSKSLSTITSLVQKDSASCVKVRRQIIPNEMERDIRITTPLTISNSSWLPILPPLTRSTRIRCAARPTEDSSQTHSESLTHRFNRFSAQAKQTGLKLGR